MEENKVEKKDIDTEEKTSEENPEWKNRVRPAIYMMAGVYLAYLSYKMLGQISVTTGQEQMIMIVFSILFAVIGLGGIIFGLKAGYTHTKKEKSQEDENQ